MSWLNFFIGSFGIFICIKLFLKFKDHKKRRFMKEAFQCFYSFGDAAQIPEDRITSLLPQTEPSKAHVIQVYRDGMKPIDAAMVMADMCVREAKQKVKFVEDGSMGNALSAHEDDIREEAEGGEFLNMFIEVLPALAESELKDAEKLQFSAFENGQRFGSLIALQEGNFAGLFDEFTKPV